MSLLDRTVAYLESRGTRAALIGAAAAAAHGVSRATQDLDLLTLDASVLDQPFWTEFQEVAGPIEIRHGDEDDPLRGVVRLRGAGAEIVDIIVGRFYWQRQAVDRAETVSLETGSLRVVQLVDLILLKLYAGGPQDAWDIRQLLRLSSTKQLITEVENGLQPLGPEAARLWNRILQEH